MDMSFDSPARLERRIAANMAAAADMSDDLGSLGVGRRAPSVSDLSFSLESDTNYFDQNESAADAAAARGATPSSRLGTPRVAALTNRRSPLAQVHSNLSPGPTPRPAGAAPNLKDSTRSAASHSLSSNMSFSDSLDRSPASLPLTSTPQTMSAGMRSQTTLSRSIIPPPRLHLAGPRRGNGALPLARKSGLSNVTNASSEGASTAWGSARDGLTAPQDEAALVDLSVDSLKEISRDQDDDSLATDTRSPDDEVTNDDQQPEPQHAAQQPRDAASVGDTSAQSDLSGGRDAQQPGATRTMHTSDFSTQPVELSSSTLARSNPTEAKAPSIASGASTSTQRVAGQRSMGRTTDSGATARNDETVPDVVHDTAAEASRLARSAATTHDEQSSMNVTSSPAAGRAERRRQQADRVAQASDGETQESIGWEPSVEPHQARHESFHAQDNANMATPRPSKVDTERMKKYVLSSVKAVNPLREAQLRRMTPRPSLRMGTATPGPATPAPVASDEAEASSTPGTVAGPRMDRLGRLNVVGAGRTPLPMRAGLLSHLQQQAALEGSPSDSASQAGFSDASSTRDLTRPTRQAALLRGNTSLPGIGLAGGGGGEELASVRRPPVDPARLQGYLHKMNARLEEENVGLQEDNERLRRALNKALMEVERAGTGRRSKGSEEGRNGEEEEEGRKEAGAEVQDQGKLDDAMERIRELEAGQEELNDLLDEREEEIEDLKNRLEEQQHQRLDGTPPASAEDDAQQPAVNADAYSEALQRQVEKLQLVVEDREGEIRELQSEIEGHRRRFEEQLRAAMEDADELQQEAEREWASERAELEAARDEAEERVREVEREVERLKRHQAEEGDGDATRERKKVAMDESRVFAEVQHLQAEIDELKTDLGERDEALNEREERLDEVERALEEAKREAEELKEVEKQLEEQLRDFDEANAEMERELEAVNARLEEVEEEVEVLRGGVEDKEKESKEARDEVLDLRIAVEEKESEILKLQSELREARDDAVKSSSNVGPAAVSTSTSADAPAAAIAAATVAAEQRIASLESALHTAKERANLLEQRLVEAQTALRASRTREAATSPASKFASSTAGGAKLGSSTVGVKAEQALLLSEVKELKRAKKELEERLQTYKEQQHHILNSSSIAIAAATGTPVVHRNVAHLRTPIRTPAGPGEMSNASWLYNESTLGDGGVVENIHALQQLLDAANASIDEKLSELDRQGVSHLTLSRKLMEAKARIEELEAELKTMRGREGEVRVMASRLRRVRCTGCKSRFDATEQLGVVGPSLTRQPSVGNLSTATASSSAANLHRSQRSAQREKVLAEVVEQLEELKGKWAVDRERFDRDRRMLDEEKREWDVQRRELRDENERLREERERREKGRREEAKRLQAQTQAELERAKSVVRDFDEELRSERERLRSLIGQSQRSGDESASAEAQLRSTEAQLRAVEAELSDKAMRHRQLHAELMERSASASLASSLPGQLRELDQQVRQTAFELDLLRKQRKDILEERRGIHDRFRSATDRFESVYAELGMARQAMEAHQAQLDEQIGTIERLHSTLQEQDAELQRVAGDRERLLAQRGEIIDEVAALERDLRRVRDESDVFAREVERLRRRKAAGGTNDRLGSSSRVTGADVVRSIDERRNDAVTRELQLAHQRFAQERLQIDAQMRTQHTAECKGLLLQIRYLKAKFMRESDLRADAAHQKRYLSQLVGGLELSERETLKFVADLRASRGLVQREEGRKDDARRKLGKCFKAVHAAVRMRLMAERWRQTCEVKKVLLDAQAEARARREKREGQEQQGSTQIGKKGGATLR